MVDLLERAKADEVPAGYWMTELGLLPRGWKVVPLGSLFDIKQGKAVSAKKQTADGEHLPFLRTANVLWGKLDLSTLDSMEFSLTEEKVLALEPGDLLTCEGGDIGRTAVWRGEISRCYYQNHVHRLRARIPDVDPQFFMFWMQAAHQVLGLYRGEGNRTTIPNLSRSRLAAFPLPLPPLPEQRASAHVLSTVQRAKGATEAVIAATREPKRSLMRHLFTYWPVPVDVVDGVRQKETEIGFVPEHWKMRPVGEMFEVQLGKMLSPKARTGRNPMEYLRNQDVRWGSVNVSRLPTMDFDSREVQKFSLRTGDILVCEGGEIGRTAVWRGELAPCSYQKAIHRLRPINGEVLPQYFAFHMMNAFLLSNVYGDTGTTTTIAHLPAVKLRSLPLSVPPIGEQHQIANMLSSVDEKLTLEESRKASLDALFRTLLHDLMTGKLRVSPDAANPTG